MRLFIFYPIHPMNTSENTPAPETEHTEATSHTKKAWFLKSTWETVRSIHPAWIVSLILTLILITLVSHTYFEREYYQDQRMFGWYHQGMIPWWYDMDRFEHHFEREFERMDREMESMRTRHRAMMQSLETLPIATSATSGKYSGSSMVNGDTLSYTLTTGSGIVKGNITLSNTGKLSKLKAQIEPLGYTIQTENNALNLSGSTKNIEKLIQVLQ